MKNWKSLIEKSKNDGEKVLVCNLENKDSINVYFSDSPSRLPDAISSIVVHTCKVISRSSGGKYTAIQALEGILSHISISAKITLENMEKSNKSDTLYNLSTTREKSFN